MLKASLTAVLIAGLAGGAPLLPAQAQTPPLLSLNEVTAAPADARNSWELTLAFGRADRSASANARSVHAPALAAHDIVISTADGTAAPFIVREVSAPVGNTLMVTVEWFGDMPLASGDRYTLTVLDPQRLTEDRDAVEFDFLPPSLPSSDG